MAIVDIYVCIWEPSTLRRLPGGGDISCGSWRMAGGTGGTEGEVDGKRLPLQGRYHEERYQDIEGDKCVESDVMGVCIAQIASQMCSCWVS